MLSLATCTIATCYQQTKRPELPIEPFRTTHASALRSVDQSLENKLSLIEDRGQTDRFASFANPSNEACSQQKNGTAITLRRSPYCGESVGRSSAKK